MKRRRPRPVFDVDAAKIAKLEAAVPAGGPTRSGTGSSTGARGAATVAAVGAACDLVLLSLPSSETVESVVTGDGGLLSHMASGGAVIDTSTTEPMVTKRIAARLAERGIGFLDAPVSGGEGGAKAAKLVNNMIVGSAVAVIAESFALGKKMGLDLEQLYQAIRGGWAGSAVLDVAAPGIVARDFTPGGSVDVLFKDLGYALSLARSQNVPTPMTAVVDEIFKAARASGRGPQTQQVIIQLWEELLGLE